MARTNDVDGDEKRCSTGCKTLDGALEGGLPRRKSVLLKGGPGTGKSTMAMQFIQAGLENGERCLFLSTEQTDKEIRASFKDFDFDMEDEDFIIETVQAATGHTLDSEGEEAVMRTMEGKGVEEGTEVPFNLEFLKRYIEKFRPFDRIVIDSVSGLRVMASEDDMFRRKMLELIRFISHDIGATSILTSEDYGAGTNPIDFSVNGVIRLWKDDEYGDVLRYLRVEKIRGVKHDDRTYGIFITNNGVRTVPRRRSPPENLIGSEGVKIGEPGFDEIVGGFEKGTLNILKQDGIANVSMINAALISRLKEEGYYNMLVLSHKTPFDRLHKIFQSYGIDIREEIEKEMMKVVKIGKRKPSKIENNHEYMDYLRSPDEIEEVFEEVYGEYADSPVHTCVYDGALGEMAGFNDVGTLISEFMGSIQNDEDIVFVNLNPKIMKGKYSNYIVDSASKVVDTWQDNDGIQYVKLLKAQSGDTGRTGMLEFHSEKPYFSVKK